MESPLLYFLLLFILSTASSYFDSHYNEDFSTANKTLRVFDAEDSNYRKHKHLVQLNIKTKTGRVTKGGMLCSASVITSNWILSSAHCFLFDPKATDMYVLVRRIEDAHWVRLGKVTKDNIIVHPGFVFESLKSDNDLAMIKTTNQMPLSKNLVPIMLENRPIKKGEKAIMTGYGDSEFGMSYLDKPREGVVYVYPCGKNLLCSFNLVRAGSGDSGGSVVSQRGRLLGVISASCTFVHIRKLCETVFVDVSQYLDWINENIGSDEHSSVESLQ